MLDDERMKNGSRIGKDYFDGLLERIREIRASERRFYLKIPDIYEQCSIDYNKTSESTEAFFKTIQNKLHWAISRCNSGQHGITDAGKVRHEVAKKLAEHEYKKFRIIQDRNFESDFDKEVKKLTGRTKSEETNKNAGL